VNADGLALGPALLLVAFHDLRPPDVGRVRLATGLAKRTALAEQIPALVERDLQLTQALPIAVAGVPGRLAVPELVLLGDEAVDRPMDL
jgi:hypothetical protein